MKVSFSTLDNPRIQNYAEILVKRGVEVWVCTSRVSCQEAYKKWKSFGYNDDLFEVTDRIKIPRERVLFTGYEIKNRVLKNKGFIWHLDDDKVELSFFEDDVRGINVKNKNWKDECEELLKNNL